MSENSGENIEPRTVAKSTHLGTVRRTLGSVFAWMIFVPDWVEPGMARYHSYWRVYYLLGGVGHLTLLDAFYRAGITFMAVFNVFSVAVFATAFFLLNLGRYRIAFWIVIVELVLHGTAATIAVGPEFTYLNYLFLIVILLFIQPFHSWMSAGFVAGVVLGIGGATKYYSMSNPPLYQWPVEDAAAFATASLILWPILVLFMVLPFVRASQRAEVQLETAYRESERLLLNILPKSIAAELKTTEDVIAQEHDNVAIMFVDIVNFTEQSQDWESAQVVSALNEIFNTIDALVAQHGAEKIKTIGDSYMIAAGVPDPVEDPEALLARLALDIMAQSSTFKNPKTGKPLQLRIGIHGGRVVAGVIGLKKFAYDLWGDTVNVASRLEATSEPGRIQVADDFAQREKDHFLFKRRGVVSIKGKGDVVTYFLKGNRAQDMPNAPAIR